MNPTLVVALIGVAGTVGGTLSGVLVTQLMSNRREAAAWQREMGREKARWAREDRARTFEHRREAYVAFYRAVSDHAQENWRYFTDVVVRGGSTKAEPQYVRAAEAYDLVAIYGSPQVRELANVARHTPRISTVAWCRRLPRSDETSARSKTKWTRRW
ncbi:hypothetical protein [Mycolicibacterium peregrinum]|uniref:hypothetical protein n=1 Tax=Mycolicibacterium peregrinum TaxID=43304 RepID=UPI003AADDFBA